MSLSKHKQKAKNEHVNKEKHRESKAKMKETEDENSPCLPYGRFQSVQERVSSAPHIPDTALLSCTLDLPNRILEKARANNKLRLRCSKRSKEEHTLLEVRCDQSIDG